jgi:hypothetical protein
MKKLYCNVKKEEVDYYKWDEYCCHCGKIKNQYSSHYPTWVWRYTPLTTKVVDKGV